MAIKEKEVLIIVTNNAKYYREKGYEIPTYIDKRNRIKIKRDTKILVKVEDLPKGSNVLVTKICDSCGYECLPQTYNSIRISRETNKDGLDKCANCSNAEIGKLSGVAKESNCIVNTHPDKVHLFWDKEIPYIRSAFSDQKEDFKCPHCGSKLKNKIIKNVFKQGLKCYCTDGKSYPEKFIFSLLNQINIDFDTEKIFEWSKNIVSKYKKLNGEKYYDFYLNELNIIVETHGIQHYEKINRKSRRGRTFEEEHENDKIKKEIANNNGIAYYVELDCRYSNIEYIKTNILKSELNNLFDLSKIDWLKCHEFACDSLVKKVCDLWNVKKTQKEISSELKITRPTVIKYLKIGTMLKLSNYDPLLTSRESSSRSGKKRGKPILRLTLDGKLIDEWESAGSVERILGIRQSNVNLVCNKKRNRETAGGYKWIFKEEYIS